METEAQLVAVSDFPVDKQVGHSGTVPDSRLTIYCPTLEHVVVKHGLFDSQVLCSASNLTVTQK